MVRRGSPTEYYAFVTNMFSHVTVSGYAMLMIELNESTPRSCWVEQWGCGRPPRIPHASIPREELQTWSHLRPRSEPHPTSHSE